MWLFSGASIAEFEQAWSRNTGQPTFALMERAAAAAVTHIRQRFTPERPVVVLCGKGNNGGDGLLVALLLQQQGWSVSLWLAGEPRAGSDAEQAWEQVRAQGMQPLPTLASLPENAQMVDALLGTGFQGAPRGVISEAIDALSKIPPEDIVALDCPSGLDASTGAAGQAVCAGSTITFIAGKVGLVTGQGAALAGQVWLDTLDVQADKRQALAGALGVEDLIWPHRPASTHKGQQGHTVVLGGEPGMVGAGIMAAEAALTAGSGLVTAMLDESAQGALLARAPEVMASTESVPDRLDSRQVVVVGPGFGRDGLSAQRWQKLCDHHLSGDQPWLVDADALFHLARQPVKRSNWVLTPHPGEAARLLGCSVAEVEVDRLAAADQLQLRFGGVIVLKGAGSVIASDEGCWIVPLSVGAMATGGMGDVLSGVIGALMAQGLTPFQAAQSGTYLMAHGASEFGRKQPVVRATDLLQALPVLMQALNFRSGHQSLNLQR